MWNPVTQYPLLLTLAWPYNISPTAVKLICDFRNSLLSFISFITAEGILIAYPSQGAAFQNNILKDIITF